MGPVSALTWVLCLITAVCPSLLQNPFLILFTCVCECCKDKVSATGVWCEWIWGLWLQSDQGCRCPAAGGGPGPSYWSFAGLTGDLVPKPLGQEQCVPPSAAGGKSVCISPNLVSLSSASKPPAGAAGEWRPAGRVRGLGTWAGLLDGPCWYMGIWECVCAGNPVNVERVPALVCAASASWGGRKGAWLVVLLLWQSCAWVLLKTATCRWRSVTSHVSMPSVSVCGCRLCFCVSPGHAQLGDPAEGKAAATSPARAETPGTGPSGRGLRQSSLRRPHPPSLTGFFVLEKHQIIRKTLCWYIFFLTVKRERKSINYIFDIKVLGKCEYLNFWKICKLAWLKGSNIFKEEWKNSLPVFELRFYV